MPDVAAGLLAGLFSALAYGSFAVPIKARAVVEAKVHPLIFQSYKSLMCFLLSWGVLAWSEFRFTWWAVLAALIWVINGVLAIISIHLAGLGVAQTIWSCISLFVSFAWGKLYFNEPMADVALTVTGLTLMALGMLSLGWIAAQADANRRWQEEPKAAAVAVVDEIFAASLEPEEDLALGTAMQPTVRTEDVEQQRLLADGDGMSSQPALEAEPHHGQPPEERKQSISKEPQVKDPGGGSSDEGRELQSSSFEGKAMLRPTERLWWEPHRFVLGVTGATIIGFLAGTMMVCLKLSPPDRQGDQYTVSFGIGVAIVTLAALAGYGFGSLLLGRRPPSFQVKVAAGPACLAGVLWTIGNYLSIVAVDCLGMAVGWPIVQCSLIVSNTWALFWYREVQGRTAVLQFLLCSLVILAGVLLLAWFGL